jgi:lytic murein transglycosylase
MMSSICSRFVGGHDRGEAPRVRPTGLSASVQARGLLGAAVAAGIVACLPGAALAADCGGGFAAWMERFKAKAAAAGITPATLRSALGDVSYDANVVRLDHSQHSFKLSFEQFYARRVDAGLIRRGQALIRRHKATFDRAERQFGVPAAVVTAIWGLETAYGRDTAGRFSILRSVATLAYDCRRSDFFTPQLVDALRIVQRGDLTPAELRGGWAGEIGQTQFLPSGYVKYAVDFDGDGRRDLVHSVPDIIASTANFLKGNGWQRGQSWEPGSANYNVIKEWNRAEVYQRTIAVMASKLERQVAASE